VETADGDLWVHDADGVAHVPAGEARQALRDSTYRPRADRFDARDRLDGPATTNVAPSAVEGTDGRIWFAYVGGVASVDPAHLPRNGVPPPITIRGIRAGEREYSASGQIALPARTTGLTIAYTAASLDIPERVRFRYRLSGLDTAWQDVGARREAVYTNLGPGDYRFQVIAANADGVWNETGATLDFVIPPTFVQTRLFLALCAMGAAGALWLLLAWRQRRVTAAIHARFDATLAERTRIAQELHDTLLQGFGSVALQVHAARRLVGTQPQQLTEVLDQAAAVADATLREARHAVWEMRAPELDELDLPGALRAAAYDAVGSEPIRLSVAVHGAPRHLPPAAEVAALRIGREAVTNSVRHAGCKTVDVTLAYGPGTLTVKVCDDGRGLSPESIDRARRNGHWGLIGMRERAAAAGGYLEIAAVDGGGTSVIAVLPTDEASGKPVPRTR
jgi:signal transduction histidine kinase